MSPAAPRSRPRPRLFIALDTGSLDEAVAWVEALAPLKTRGVGLKLGYQFFLSGGFAHARRWRDAGWSLFYDLKLYDIPNTIGGALKALSSAPPDFLTVHAQRQTMLAARDACDALGLPTRLLAVTLLTSMSADDLTRDGITADVKAQVLRRARQAMDCNLDGIIASAQETRLLREALGARPLLITPGIRVSDERAAPDDQQRTLTPQAAKAAGADALVVGRPITQALDPETAAVHILNSFS